MPRDSLKRFGRLAAAMAVLAGCASGPAHAAGTGFEIGEHYEVRVDGTPIEGARVFERSKGWGRYLVDIPSEATLFLIDTSVRTVFAVRRVNVSIANDGATASVKELFAWNVPLTSVGAGLGQGVDFGFQNGDLAVRVVREMPKPKEPATTPPAQAAGGDSPAPGAPPPPAGGTTPEVSVPVVGPAPAARRSAAGPARPGAPTRPASNAPPARECVSLESRPATGIPGCTRSVYIRNRCDSPVIAVVQRTEHLMTGTLPQAFDVPVVPSGEQWLGCSWWTGAMAPADHEIAGAIYVEPVASR